VTKELRMAPTSPRVQPVQAKFLTARQLTVLKLMADGLTTTQIAKALGVSFKTAATHRDKIRKRLGVDSTILAVRWAIRERLIEP